MIDLFSGAGGMSSGFQAHPRFCVVGAVDAELGKPSTGMGAIDCNSTYKANIGVEPVFADLSTLDPQDLRDRLELKGALGVLCACPPCTGFSRTIATNHLIDDPRNSLVVRTAAFVEEFRPLIVLMENARELISGKFTVHYKELCRQLQGLGYGVSGAVHMLTRFGLPQFRERAVVVAVRGPLPLRTLDDLWAGYRVCPEATHVRRAISHLPPLAAGQTCPEDGAHTATDMGEDNLGRIRAIPRDGGSWRDLIGHEEADRLLNPAMKKNVEAGTPNHFCDVYGRMWWDRPAPTIKRECCHIGNGRYAHPEQDRLCTVREMALLQGFPRHYRFVCGSRKNMYRNIGDAVPPLISYQLASLCEWILSGRRPSPADLILPGTHLTAGDIESAPVERTLFSLVGL